MNLEELEKDIVELKTIFQTVQRPENKIFIENQLKVLTAKQQTLKAQIPPKITNKVQQTQTTTSNSNFVTLTKYSYEQQGKKVKIYFLLDNIGKQCKEQQIQVNFTSNSLELKILGYKGQNHSFVVRRLASPIEPKQSKFILKNNQLILSLTKSDTKHWDGINYKESILDKEKTPKEKDEDPNASLMNLMKKMYDQGDDNMKRTIAQTWQKSRQGKQPNFDQKMPPFGQPSFRPYNKRN